MNQFTTEIVQAVVPNQDITEVFRAHLETALNSLLATELIAFLDYEKYDRVGFNSGNSRNDSYERSLKIEFGELTIQIPRDRNGEFKQQTAALEEMFKKLDDPAERTGRSGAKFGCLGKGYPFPSYPNQSFEQVNFKNKVERYLKMAKSHFTKILTLSQIPYREFHINIMISLLRLREIVMQLLFCPFNSSQQLN